VEKKSKTIFFGEKSIMSYDDFETGALTAKLDLQETLLAEIHKLQVLFEGNQPIIPLKPVAKTFISWLRHFRHQVTMNTVYPLAGVVQLDMMEFLLNLSQKFVIEPLHQECVQNQNQKACKKMVEHLGKMKAFSSGEIKDCHKLYEKSKKTLTDDIPCANAWSKLYDQFYHHIQAIKENLSLLSGGGRLSYIRDMHDEVKSWKDTSSSLAAREAAEEAKRELENLRQAMSHQHLHFANSLQKSMYNLKSKTLRRFEELNKRQKILTSATERFRIMVQQLDDKSVQDYFFMTLGDSMESLNTKIEEIMRNAGERGQAVSKLLSEWKLLHRAQIVQNDKWNLFLVEFGKEVVSENMTVNRALREELIKIETEQFKIRGLLQDLKMDNEAEDRIKKLSDLTLKVPNHEVMEQYAKQMQKLKSHLEDKRSKVQRHLEKLENYISQAKDELHKMQRELEQSRAGYHRLEEKRLAGVFVPELVRLQQDFGLSFDSYATLEAEAKKRESLLDDLHKKRDKHLKSPEYRQNYESVESMQKQLMELVRLQKNLEKSRFSEFTKKELRDKIFQIQSGRIDLQDKLRHYGLLQGDSERELRDKLLNLEEWKFNVNAIMKMYMFYFLSEVLLEMFFHYENEPQRCYSLDPNDSMNTWQCGWESR